jgi:hypothetical protein
VNRFDERQRLRVCVWGERDAERAQRSLHLRLAAWVEVVYPVRTP